MFDVWGGCLMPRPKGKPSKYTVQVNIRVSPGMKRRIEKKQQHTGWSQDRVIREWIRKGWKVDEVEAENKALRLENARLEKERDQAVADIDKTYRDIDERLRDQFHELANYIFDAYADYLQDKESFKSFMIEGVLVEPRLRFMAELWNETHGRKHVDAEDDDAEVDEDE